MTSIHEVEEKQLRLYKQAESIANDLLMIRSQLLKANKGIVKRGFIAIGFFFVLLVLTIGVGFQTENLWGMLAGVFPAFFMWYIWKSISPFRKGGDKWDS